ncbi:T-cell receptor gamma alternate reading frame protein [Cyanocitta cristata]
MLLLVVLVATASWSYGFAQEIPMQSPISITKFQKSARMTCEIQTSKENVDGIVIHWYKQKEGEAPERLLFFSGGKVTTESGFQVNRYMVERISVQKQCVLTIKDVIPDDAATYYCAYWDPHCDRNTKIIKGLKIDYMANLIFFKEYYLPMQTQLSCTDIVKALFTVIGYYNKVFGSGTKLIVSEKGSSPPANSEILQKKHENQIIYVCLIEKFYPEVIRVTWTDDEKEVTDNVVKGDTWQSTKEDEYSIASWLTVPAENKDKKYYCKYEHEEEKASLPTQVDSVKTAPQEEDCGTVFNRDQLMHRTAYLVYIVLLLKSSMYYLIILFFIYRTWASTKYQGKKA